MVNTIKFSQFPVGNYDSSNIIVGLDSGQNAQFSRIPQWTTATRPATPFNGIIGYNTDLSQYEYYDSALGMWVQLITSQTGMDWSLITAISVDASTNSGYIAFRSATPVNLLLPALCNIGDEIIVMGSGSGGWSLIANVGQQIAFGNQITAVEGSISSTLQYDNVAVRCISDNTLWSVLGVQGNLTVM